MMAVDFIDSLPTPRTSVTQLCMAFTSLPPVNIDSPDWSFGLMTLLRVLLWDSVSLAKNDTQLKTAIAVALKSTQQRLTPGWKVGLPHARHTHYFERALGN